MFYGENRLCTVKITLNIQTHSADNTLILSVKPSSAYSYHKALKC